MILGEQINGFMQEMTDKLDNRFPPRLINNMPDSPLVIIYTGEYALNARPYIMEAFTNVWRMRAKAISHLLYVGGDLSRIDNETGDREILEYGLGDVIDELQEKDDCFRNMSGLMICTVESMDDYENVNGFCDFEESLMEIIQDSEINNYKLTRFVLLNESVKRKRDASGIRDYIKDNSDRDPNETLVLFSNKLRDNSKINSKSPINYQLVGSSILILNGTNEKSVNGKSLFYQGEHNTVLTASYSRLRRPNRRIIETILMTAVNWIKENQLTGVVLDYNELCNRLRLSGGHMEVVDKFFENNIKALLPPAEVLEYFPRKSKNMGMLSTLAFEDFQKETFEIYDDFIDGLVVFEKNTMDIFRNSFRELLERTISTTEAACSLTDTNIDSIVKELKMSEHLSGKMPAGKYMAEQMKQSFSERICSICREEMKRYYKDARSRETMLDDIIVEIQNNMITNTGDHVQQYYEDLTRKFLAGEDGRKFLNEYRDCSGDAEVFFDSISKLVDALFTKERVFSLPLEGELAKRLGDADENYQRILQNELMKDIEKKARLKTILPISVKSKVIMANRADEKGADTEISKFLKSLLNDASGDTFFDTGNRNLIETIVFYTVNVKEL